jgi:hypothetical protein
MSLRRRPLLGLPAWLLWAGAGQQAWAASPETSLEPPLRIEGLALPRRVRVGSSELRLNGAGVRQVAWFKAFVAALYLNGRADSATELQALAGPKRLQMILLHEVPAAELSKALNRGVQRNSSAAQREALATPMATLAAQIDALGTLKKGDLLDLDWEPTRGVQLSLNGTLRGEPLGSAPSQAALHAAVLRAFVGERPYDERLKAALLGRPAAARTSQPGD